MFTAVLDWNEHHVSFRVLDGTDTTGYFLVRRAKQKKKLYETHSVSSHVNVTERSISRMFGLGVRSRGALGHSRDEMTKEEVRKG